MPNPLLFCLMVSFPLTKPPMTGIGEKLQKSLHGTVLILSISLLSTFTFAFNVLAAGIVPADVMTLANSARTKMGLLPLSENNKLSEAARSKANDMIKNDYFAHVSPTGVEPWYWIKQSGYQYQSAGENLAINYTNAKDQQEAWMKSETHRANILNTHYRDIGVAVASGKIAGKESTVTVEYFGTPLAAAVLEKSSTPTKAAPAVNGAKDGVALPQPLETAPELTPTSHTVIPMTPLSQVTDTLLLDSTRMGLIWAVLLSLTLISAPLVVVARAYIILIAHHVVAAPKTPTV